MGLLPLIWVTAWTSAGRIADRRTWLLALAFAVSWVADGVSHWTGTFPVGPVYVVIQSGLIVAAFAPRVGWRFGMVLLGASALALTRFDLTQPDIFVHTVAWLGLLAVTWPLASPFRLTLALAFGLGTLAWWGYCLRPGWASWLVYQGVRAVSLLSFCWASRYASAPA